MTEVTTVGTTEEASEETEVAEVTVASRYADVCDQLALTRAMTGAGDVRLIAVSKTFGLDRVEAAYAAGAREFGENYVQEGVEKARAMKAKTSDTVWHLIGPLQSNKTRPVAEVFDWVQTIDREKIAQRLNDQRPEGMAPLQVLIEVNLDNEPTKSGVSIDDIEALAAKIVELPRLTLRGLMVIPDPMAPLEQKVAQFERIRSRFVALQAKYPSVDTLSMGMSADWRIAIAHGSTMIRVGRQIFGPRDYPIKT